MLPVVRMLIRAVSPPGTTYGPSPSVRAWIRYIAVLVAAASGAYFAAMLPGGQTVAGVGLVAAAVGAAA